MSEPAKVSPSLEVQHVQFEGTPVLDNAWLQKYNILLAFVAANNDKLPTPETNPELDRWIKNQRTYLKTSKRGRKWMLKMMKMKEIGIEIPKTEHVTEQPTDKETELDKPATTSRRPRRWGECLAALVAYKEEHGTFVVNQKLDNALYRWATHQRRKWYDLSEEQREMLRGIGFENSGKTYPSYDERWNAMVNELKAYKRLHGNCLVPATTGLGSWVVRQRDLYHKGVLLPDRQEQLESLNFDWQTPSAFEKRWNNRLHELKAYKRLHGHCMVPMRGKGLGPWVVRQRVLYHKGSLSRDRQEQLESLNFVWNVYKGTRKKAAMAGSQAASKHPATSSPPAEKNYGEALSKNQERPSEKSAKEPAKEPVKTSAKATLIRKTTTKTRKRILFASPSRKCARITDEGDEPSANKPDSTPRATNPPQRKPRMSLWGDVPILQPEPGLWSGPSPFRNPHPLDTFEI